MTGAALTYVVRVAMVAGFLLVIGSLAHAAYCSIRRCVTQHYREIDRLAAARRVTSNGGNR